GGTAERYLDVVVVHEQPPPPDGVALRRDTARAEQVVAVCLGHPLLALQRLEATELVHPAWGLKVVEDRLVAREALEPHHLLREESAVVTKRHVALAGDLAAGLVSHSGSPLHPVHAVTLAPWGLSGAHR